MTARRFAIKTLGCKVNQYEEQVIREKALNMGYEETTLKDADIFILNSCTVTGEADRKTLQLIRKAKRDNPGVRVVVTGCYAVVEKDIEKLRAMPEVDMVVPGKDKTRLNEILSGQQEDMTASPFSGGISSFSGHTRAFLKIQDGCDQRCSYCKVNIVRGPSVSRPFEDIISEISTLTSKGHREIVLTGICVGAWKTPSHPSLADLIEKIDGLPGHFRVRISSIEPNHIDGNFIKALSASKKFCRHLHIPLQSGSDAILRGMKRRYTSDKFKSIVSDLRREMPLLGISMDIIAGFPGESDSDFEKTRDFISQLMPSRLHVFPYSDRPGTEASVMGGKIPSKEAKKRVALLLDDGRALQEKFCNMFIGKEIEALIESVSENGIIEGYTSEYARVRTSLGRASLGDLVRLNAVSVVSEGPFLMAE